MTRRARLRIDTDALTHNAQVARRHAGTRDVFVAVKADAYGHGMERVAHCLLPEVDGFFVATVGEGERLRKSGITKRIMILQGVMDQAEARRCARSFLEPVFHHQSQIDAVGTHGFGLPLTAWMKLDTGMHRAGFNPDEFPQAYAQLAGLRGLRERPGVLTHFARADEPDRPETPSQIACFQQSIEPLNTVAGAEMETSLCNSAGLLAFPEAGGSMVRPGIMIYGGNPFVDGTTAADHDLRPVMTLTAPLIAVRSVPKGAPIGYGGRYVAPEAMPVGVVSIGYGDGYPRHAPDGTPVVVNGQRTQLIGRVSMDMVTVDLRNIQASVGDEVELWGPQLPVDEISSASETISYELMCQMSGRVALVE